MEDVVSIIGLIFLIVLLIIVGPVFTIWSLNCLFGLAIPLNFYTWLSTAWLCILFNPARKKKE